MTLPNIDTRQEDHFFDIGPIGIERTVSVGFDIASVRVHNPSGMWLLLPQNQQYIPPNTLGAYLSIKPTTKTLRIKYVSAPTGGQPSSVTGGPIQITVFAAENADFTGLDYGLVASIEDLSQAVNDLQYSIDHMVNGFGSGIILKTDTIDFGIDATGTSDTMIVAPVVGQRIAITNVFITFSDMDMPAAAQFTLYGSTTLWTICRLGVSPETPYVNLMIPKVSDLVPDVGEGVSIVGSWTEDFSNISISAFPRNFTVSVWWYVI